MDITEDNLKALALYLQKTLSSDINERKPAENFLESVEGNQNYPILLLTLVEKEGIDMPIRISAAINFKNFVKRNWRIIDDQANKICQTDREAVKSQIVGLMLRMPEQIQRQLSDAISIIGREDFPKHWPSLLPEMVSKFKSGDFHIINGVLQTAHSLFKRYRHEFKSNELWSEIKLVLDGFAAPLTELFVVTGKLVEEHAANPAAAKVLYSSLTLICKVFYSLNFQDLPAFFEDNMKTWMTSFHTLLVGDNKLLHTNDEEEAGPLEKLKSQICDNVALYAQKYDEEFTEFLPNFVTAIWNLLVTTGKQVKYDLLVSNAIQFLASVAEKQQYKGLFEAHDTLTSICEKVVVTNMEFRDADEEMFEDNPEEYIRRDIEGSDIDTRRRAACDLVRALCRYFEGPVIQIFSQYVIAMLQEYAKNPSSNWKSKDAAIYLVTSLATKTKTQKHGTRQTSELVNLTDFFKSNIVPDLQLQNVDACPVLKADTIKYVMTFRNQLAGPDLVSAFPLLVNHLKAKSVVVHTYAAHAIERTFTMKSPAGTPVVTAEDVKPHLENLVLNLFNALSLPGSSENEYIMKAIMRSFSMMQEAIVPYVPALLDKLTKKLSLVSKNPSKPHFNHYLFESLSLCVRICCGPNPASVSSFEEAFFPTFLFILQQDVQEFLPYIFQILSLMLEMHSQCPENYLSLFPHLLTPVLWERPGNIPPLVRLLQAYIHKGARLIGTPDKLSGLLGVFQKLIASKSNDHEGFYLINSLVEKLEPTELEQFKIPIFRVLFQRLHSSKTTKYVKHLLVFYCLYVIKYSALSLIEIFDGIQPKIFRMVAEKVIVTDVQKVSGVIERKICAVGITKMLTECPPLVDGEYAKLWGPLLQALIGLFELPEDDSVPEDEHFIEIEDTPGYQTAYSQLVFAGKKEHDPFQGSIPDPRLHLATALHRLSQSQPSGKVSSMIVGSLAGEALQYLQKYLNLANVQI